MSSAADAARAAAARLADELGRDLPAQVEAALAAGETRPQRFVDPISLGSLVVAVASLAWTIYRDQRQQTRAPSAAVLERRVRVELDAGGDVAPPERDRVVAVVVEEIVRGEAADGR